ncbi:MAG: hypothetical protein NC218_01295 [Acetobacter sp.]|nr:hypothetical protein [Acetobacter sp.]
MGRFFDSDSQVDESVVKTHDDYARAVEHAAPANEHGGTSNEAFLNDYRNRMPYHYIEEGSEGYYYWQYGATMEIEFEITDEVAFTDPTPPFVVDVRINGKSVVDKDTGVAELTLGSMAEEEASDYYTAKQTEELLGRVIEMAETTQIAAEEANRRASKMSLDVYSMIGQAPGVSDNYTVANNIPFTCVLRKDQEEITINGTTFKEFTCVDASNMQLKLQIDIKDMPKEVPFLAIYDVHEEEPRLLTGLASLPPVYLMTQVLPFMEKNFLVKTKNLRLSEDTDPDEEEKPDSPDEGNQDNEDNTDSKGD